MYGLHKVFAIAYLNVLILMHSGTTCNLALLYDVVSPLDSEEILISCQSGLTDFLE